jgi:endonuclease/exonuclease/phosphatase family metal-dependent hydrolase
MPRLLWARLELAGRPVILVNTHPIPPRTFDAGCARLSCYNTGPRDAQIADLRRFVDELRARSGDPMLLAGDMNLTEREPAYTTLAMGLRDAHQLAGSGFGGSWRPDGLGLPFGLLRIDYLLADSGLRPVSLHTDCASHSSDHCLLVGSFALEPEAVAGP